MIPNGFLSSGMPNHRSNKPKLSFLLSLYTDLLSNDSRLKYSIAIPEDRLRIEMRSLGRSLVARL